MHEGGIFSLQWTTAKRGSVSEYCSQNERASMLQEAEDTFLCLQSIPLGRGSSACVLDVLHYVLCRFRLYMVSVSYGQGK